MRRFPSGVALLFLLLSHGRKNRQRRQVSNWGSLHRLSYSASLNMLRNLVQYTWLGRIVIKRNKVEKQEVLFKDIGRVRDVTAGPDGFIYVALNKSDKITRLEPVN